MSKSRYLPNGDADRNIWLTNFNTKLPAYAGALGLSAADIASVAADTAFFNYVFNVQQQTLAYAQQWTSYKNAARDGHAASLGAFPIIVGFGTAPAMVAPGIFNRVAALVARIKAAPGYTDAIGQALGIVGADSTVDVNTMKPILTAEVDAGAVNLGWKKSGMDGIEFQVDRGDGKGFVFLAVDTIPDYTDTAALPAAGTSAVWKYKAIYRLNDERAGQWSDVVSVAVMG
jgi:hypothetical protein